MKSYLQGRKALPSIALRAPAGMSSLLAHRPEERQTGAFANDKNLKEAGHHGEAQVEVVKEGDKIVRLVITCRCGERTEIECLYSAGT